MAAPAAPETVRVEGLAAFVRAMKAAEVDMADLKDANQAASAIVLRAAQARAPRRSGALAGSGRTARAVRKGTVRFGNARVPYANPIHWGWPRRNIRPNPFGLEAARAAEPVWLGIYARALSQIAAEVERSTQ